MKRLLTAVYLYLGIFFALCMVCWIVTGEEPAALIAGISAAAGVESVIAGCMRMREMQEERNRENDRRADRERDGEPSMESTGSIPAGSPGRTSAGVPGRGSAESYSINPAWGEK